MNLQRMKQLAGIKLNESVTAVPGLSSRSIAENENDFYRELIGDIRAHLENFEFQPGETIKQSRERMAVEMGWPISSGPFNSAFGQAFASFQDDQLNAGSEEDYTDYSMRQGEMGNPDRMYEQGEFDTYPGQPKPSYEGKSREELEAQLSKLKSQFDPEFEFSDDHSFWKRQSAIKRHIEAIEKALGGVNEDESDMQTAATVASNQGDIGFDMAQGGVTESGDDSAFTLALKHLTELDDGDRDFEQAMSIVVHRLRNEQHYDEDEINDIVQRLEQHVNGANNVDQEYDMKYEGYTAEGCLQNGYDTEKYANGEDYFPNGADGPVVKATGPSGAKQGDNPEQKKMQVAETHKELVYAYRSFLKESANTKKKIV